MSAVLWESFSDNSTPSSPKIPSVSPKISVLSEKWLREMRYIWAEIQLSNSATR